MAGNAHNIIPTSVKLTGTVRTLRRSVRDMIETRMGQMVAGTAMAFGAKGRLDYLRNYPVTVNHAAETEYAAQAAEAVAGVNRVSRDMPPTMGGEDFSFMLNEVPGAMINIGNGDSANLHNPGYDFNDDAIAWGVSYWGALVQPPAPESLIGTAMTSLSLPGGLSSLRRPARVPQNAVGRTCHPHPCRRRPPLGRRIC